MVSPATLSDVTTRFPRALTESELEFADTKLADAWADLVAALPDLPQRIVDATTPDLSTQAARVLGQSVCRVLLNPYARKQESRGIDDATRAWTLADGVAAGELYFTDAELDSLRGETDPDEPMRGKAFSVTPS